MKFAEVYCYKCGQRLAEIRVDSEVYCPQCNVWTTAKEVKDDA